MGPAFGKVSGTWEKDWFSFWEVTDKLEKNVGSVVGPTSYDPLGLGFHPHHNWITLLPPGTDTNQTTGLLGALPIATHFEMVAGGAHLITPGSGRRDTAVN